MVQQCTVRTVHTVALMTNVRETADLEFVTWENMRH